MAKPARAVSPRRLSVTPALLADIRHRYEHTPESLSTMAADLGCSTETVRNIAAREGWVRYVAPPRDLTPAAKLAARARQLASSPLIPAQAGIQGQDRDAPEIDEANENAEPPQVADTAEQLHCELQALLAEVRATRERMKREGYGKHELREAAQTIASLTASLRTLQTLPCRVPQTGAEPDYDDMPADLDEFRRELARRIRIFVEGRRARSGAGAVSADDAAADQP